MAYLHIGRAPPRLIPQTDGTIWFFSTYDREKTPAFVRAFKATIPYSDRKPIYEQDKFSHWAVAPQHAETLADLAEQYLGRRPRVPQVQAQVQTETRLLDVRYIGASKERAGGQKTASGWMSGG